MYQLTKAGLAMGALLMSSVAIPSEGGMAKPNLVLKSAVIGMPTAEEQEIRVLTASFNPGDRTIFHTHRSPVTVYILEGAFTLNMDGHDPVVVKAGEAFVESPNTPMTGFNTSATEPLKLVIFYVSDRDTPFLDPISP